MLCSVIFLFLIYNAAYISTQDDLIIQLPDGKIQGHTLKSYKGNPYYGFQEIPYAAPPIGENRFKEPKSPEPWSGVRDATKNTNICIQFIQLSNFNSTSEDCLFLNVYTPQKPGTADLLPVYVWIHGGGFLAGSGSFVDSNPSRFMDYGIVVVTLNYRLGPLGFLSTEDDVIPGNIGLKDQAFAIKWVNANIHLFGGDPDKVTIGGESAGAFSIGYQLLGRGNSGLFRAAIQESGSSLSQVGYSAKSKVNAFNLGKTLDPNFQSDKSEDLLTLLKGVSAQDLLAANSKIIPADDNSIGYVTKMPWVPVIEGSNARNPFLTAPMLQSFMDGNFQQVPVLMGFNSEESLSFLVSNPDDSAAKFDEDPTLLVDSRLNIAPENALTFSTQLKKIYTDSAFVQDKAACVKLSSDTAFTTSVIRQAEVLSAYVPIYLYQFSYMGLESIFGGLHNLVPGAEGASHGEELFYVWEMFAPESPTDIATMNKMLLLLTNFIKYLNPTPTADPVLDNVIWSTVQDSEIPYLNINETLEMQINPRSYSKNRDLLLKYVQPPYTVF